jgi:hypothetical protein
VRLGGSQDRIATDARVCVVERPSVRQEERHALAIAARRLSMDGRLIFEAEDPVTIAIEERGGLRVSVHAVKPTRLGLPAGERLVHAFLNREPLEVRRGSDLVHIQIPAGAHEVELSELSRPLARMSSLLARDLAAIRTPANVPALLPGVRATSSTCGREGLAAIDGDSNTAWTSLPGPMPQWVLISLTRPVRLNQIRLEPGKGCSGRVEIHDTSLRNWTVPHRFEVGAEQADTLLDLPTINTNQIRVVFEEIQRGTVATLKSLEWAEVPADARPRTQPAADPHVRVIVPLTTSQAQVLRRALSSRPAAWTQPTR